MSKRARNEAESARYPEVTVASVMRIRAEVKRQTDEAIAKETPILRADRLMREWQENERREKDRNMQMPSKRPPSSRFVYGRDWKGCPVAMESKEAFARRVARWYKRHGKKK